jgi:pteridine reductase
MNKSMDAAPQAVVLITGAAHRVGASVARHFHRQGFRVAIHYHQSRSAADALVAELCRLRDDSAIGLAAALGDIAAIESMVEQLVARWGRLDVLINNASSFYPTPLGQVDEGQWQDLINSNLKGPFFLSQSCLPALRASHGCIINMVDIHARRPLLNHPVYCIAKAGLAMLTESLALEASPTVRVNGIAPGAILWPAGDAAISAQDKQSILEKIPQGRRGEAADIARTAWFLATQAPYITGQIIAVDGGRSIGD